MKKRMRVITLAVAAMLTVSLVRVGLLSVGIIKTASVGRSGFTITVTIPRGTVYDCNMNRLTNTATKRLAILTADPETVACVTSQMGEGGESILARLKSGKPTLCEVPMDFECPDGLFFNVDSGVPSDCLAPHIIGYLDAEGKGVTGVQRAYESLLGSAEPLKVTYTVDATGRALSGISPTVSGSATKKDGVVLTIDARVQRIIHNCGEFLQKGAVIVMESSTGKIRGMASFPDFSPAAVDEALSSTDGPLINRALTLYNVGSVFKPCVTVAALNGGISTQNSHTCDGFTQVGNIRFNCNAHRGHGLIDMTDALAMSCNCYYIKLGQQVGAASLYSTCIRMGFNRAYSLFEGVGTSAGRLPSIRTLSTMPAALANLSFGQGELMLSPLHIAVMTASVANGGMLVTPSMVEATVKNEKKIPAPESPPQKVLKAEIADTLSQMMMQVVQRGTGKSAATDDGLAGGKTATAETGWIKDGKSVTQSWFAGFWREYTVVVLCEDGISGSADCAPVFKKICDMLSQL